MDPANLGGIYDQTQNLFLRRSILSFISMPESDMRRDLHSTLDRLEHGKGRKKGIVPAKKTTRTWNVKKKLCIAALFLLYALLICPCTMELVVLFKTKFFLSETIRILEDTEISHSLSVVLMENTHCIVRNRLSEQVVCEIPQLPQSSHCLRYHTLRLLTNIHSFSGRNQSLTNQSSSHLQELTNSCIKQITLDLHSVLSPDIGPTVINVINYVQASFSAFDVIFRILSHCISNDEFLDIVLIVQDLNYVKANLLSFFIKDDLTNPLGNLTILQRNAIDSIFTNESNLCLLNDIEEMLLSPLELIGISQKHLQKVKSVTRGSMSRTQAMIAVYLVVLLSMPGLCLGQFVGVRRLLVFVQELSKQYAFVSDKLMEEKIEFEAILGEVIPKAMFGDIISSEEQSLTSLSSNNGKNSNCTGHVQVSFSDAEDSESDDENIKCEFRGSKDSMINRFRQKQTMGTIPEMQCMQSNFRTVTSQKKNVPAQSEVTIFRSDIIGFLNVIKYSSPSQIVFLVSYLMKLFDERIRLYDVFVIGREANSFTVVSGITSAQITRHASEIVNMALDLMSVCSDLEFERGPETKLRLRMGIHTGTCYCRQTLFPRPRFYLSGEIFHTVRKIQQNAKPNQIQMSDATYQLLSKHFAYNLQKCGCINIENEKSTKVYLLNGRRVSEDVTSKDCPGRKTTWIPIQLEQKALYRFEADENKYIAPPSWMMPSCSYSVGSNSSSSYLSTCASGRSSASRGGMSTHETLNEAHGY